MGRRSLSRSIQTANSGIKVEACGEGLGGILSGWLRSLRTLALVVSSFVVDLAKIVYPLSSLWSKSSELVVLNINHGVMELDHNRIFCSEPRMNSRWTGVLSRHNPMILR